MKAGINTGNFNLSSITGTWQRIFPCSNLYSGVCLKPLFGMIKCTTLPGDPGLPGMPDGPDGPPGPGGPVYPVNPI